MAQDQLVKQFLDNRDTILGFIFALTRDYAVAEEIFQDVAIVILEEARRETAVVNYLAWSREIARRRVAEYYRKRGRRHAIEQTSDALTDVIGQAFGENEAVREDHQLRMQYLLECVQRLQGRSRELIEGFYNQRKSIRDLAAALAWQENSVKVALSRTRKVLADCINSRQRKQETT